MNAPALLLLISLAVVSTVTRQSETHEAGVLIAVGAGPMADASDSPVPAEVLGTARPRRPDVGVHATASPFVEVKEAEATASAAADVPVAHPVAGSRPGAAPSVRPAPAAMPAVPPPEA